MAVLIIHEYFCDFLIAFLKIDLIYSDCDYFEMWVRYLLFVCYLVYSLHFFAL